MLASQNPINDSTRVGDSSTRGNGASGAKRDPRARELEPDDVQYNDCVIRSRDSFPRHDHGFVPAHFNGRGLVRYWRVISAESDQLDRPAWARRRTPVSASTASARSVGTQKSGQVIRRVGHDGRGPFVAGQPWGVAASARARIAPTTSLLASA